MPPAMSVATVWISVAPGAMSTVADHAPPGGIVAVTPLTTTLCTGAPAGFCATMPETVI